MFYWKIGVFLFVFIVVTVSVGLEHYATHQCRSEYSMSWLTAEEIIAICKQ